MFGSVKRAARKRAKNISKIRASRDASEQAIFMGNSRKGQDAWAIATGKKKNVGWSQDELKTIAADKAKAQQVLKGSEGYFDGVKQQLRKDPNGPNLSPDQRKQVMADARAKQAEIEQAKAIMKMETKGGREITTGDRWKAAGTAVGEYYMGGTGKQMAARIGGTAGAIVGVPIAADAIGNAMNSNGGGQRQY
jgi:hypothetical protein